MLDPRKRESWQGFLDLLQPPAGYRLAAAIGTSFGLSVDVLTAALLSMSEADGEALAREPVAGVMAITRQRHKVRVLVHPGTISASPHAGSRRFCGAAGQDDRFKSSRRGGCSIPRCGRFASTERRGHLLRCRRRGVGA